MERIIGHKYIVKKIVKIYNRRNDRIVLVQINPALFNSDAYKGFANLKEQVMSKFPKEEEKKVEKPKKNMYANDYYYKPMEQMKFKCVEEETDFNNGFDESILKVMVHLKTYEKSTFYYNTARKVEVITPRYLHIRNHITLAQLHLEVFDFIKPIFTLLVEKTRKMTQQ